LKIEGAIHPKRRTGECGNRTLQTEIGVPTGGDPIAESRNGGFMFKIKYVVPATILLGGFLVSSTLSFGKPEYVKTTKKACKYCHVDSTTKEKAKELTEAGKYFKEHNNSLNGYVEKK
jgi:hypothetical protein